MTFAAKLRELRDAAGLSEAKLAQASGVSFAALHDYGLSRRKPSFAAVVKIARALGVTCEAFADCTDIAEEPSAIVNQASGQVEARRPPGQPPETTPSIAPGAQPEAEGTAKKGRRKNGRRKKARE
jgi:transcriptional regulator with XRE-family HTH domain